MGFRPIPVRLRCHASPGQKAGSLMRKTIDFLLNDWLDVVALTAHARYSDHSRETFESVLDTCQRIADEKFAP